MPQQHFLSRDQLIWSFGPDLQPVLEVEPGDVVTFQTNDCFTGQIRSEDDLVTEIDLTRLNSPTGPVAVRGAEPGDRPGRGAGRSARRLARRGDPRRPADRVGRRDADPRVRAADRARAEAADE